MSTTPEERTAPEFAAPSSIPAPPNSPMRAGEPDHATPPRRRRAWLRPAAGALGCVVLGGVLGFGVAQIEWPAAHPIEDALKTCAVENSAYFELGDEGTSLTIETVGSKRSYGAKISDVNCVLRELKTPDSTISRMGQTRALDGRQTATWHGYSASWGYHPEDGMNLVVETAPSR